MIQVQRHPFNQTWCEAQGCRRHAKVGFRSDRPSAPPYERFPSREWKVCFGHVAWAIECCAYFEDRGEYEGWEPGSSFALAELERLYGLTLVGADGR